jgi:hypothetical protein
MPSTTEMCHCGEPLHYLDKVNERTVLELVAEKGEFVDVTTPEGTWRVQRHYIALHGLRAWELPTLGFEQVAITCRLCGMTSHNPNDIREKYCGNCHEFR